MPLSLTVAVERFKVGRTFQYATLVRSGPAPKLVEWFAHYNARQTIDTLAGIRLQVLFTGLAANVVRWCRAWLKNCAAETTPRLTRVLNSPKHVVRAAANAPAFVQQTDTGTAICFGLRSALPGAAFMLRGVPAIQLPLGFHRPCKAGAP
ncbi:MAG: hypothetical protein IT318_26370 [Anaerolineales bacterium]|nr:hypothetical protein [Anaerolineales bacterium]